jgi:hypothetical protein
MRLAPAVFERMMTALGRRDDRPLFDRVLPKVGLRARVTLVPFGVEASTAMTGTVHDAWAEGITVACAAPVGRGRQVAVLVPCGMRKPMRLLCTVVQCRPDPAAGGFLISADYGAAAVDTLAHVLAMPRQTLRLAA